MGLRTIGWHIKGFENLVLTPYVGAAFPIAEGVDMRLQHITVIKLKVVPFNTKCLRLFNVLQGNDRAETFADSMNKRAVQNTYLQGFIFCELGYNRTWSAIFRQVPNDNSDPVVSFLWGLSPVVGKTDL